MFIFIPVPLQSAEQVIFIANKNVSADSLSGENIKNIFLGVMTKWPDQKKINFAIMSENSSDSKTHDRFTRVYTHKTSGQFQRYWRNQLFTGKQKMPPMCKSQQAMVDFVKEHDGAIGYVSSSASVENVKVITVIEK